MSYLAWQLFFQGLANKRQVDKSCKIPVDHVDNEIHTNVDNVDKNVYNSFSRFTRNISVIILKQCCFTVFTRLCFTDLFFKFGLQISCKRPSSGLPLFRFSVQLTRPRTIIRAEKMWKTGPVTGLFPTWSIIFSTLLILQATPLDFAPSI